MIDRFRQYLLEWYGRVQRDLPWRRTRDPYAVWVSEVMLQQTRVASAIPYFDRFLAKFPNVEALAAASEDELLATWSGLGYYSRVRNMHLAARAMDGVFPEDYSAIRALPGIGEYTAAAVGSIAFGLPHAAVDGNVLRVLARVSNEAGDIGLGAVRRRITELAQRLLDPENPGTFNQAMMELGATLCLPRDPQCQNCPVQPLCAASAAGTQLDLPVKPRRPETVRMNRTVYLVERGKALLLWQRPVDSPKLAGFWELPEPEHLVDPPVGVPVGHFQHSITNHNYTFEVRVADDAQCRDEITHAWMSGGDLKTFPVSTTVRKALQLYRSSH